MNTSNTVNWEIYRNQTFGSPNRWDEGNNFTFNPQGKVRGIITDGRTLNIQEHHN
jgi:hypothetical protein